MQMQINKDGEQASMQILQWRLDFQCEYSENFKLSKFLKC